jgi:microcystin degradation protein MlrC
MRVAIAGIHHETNTFSNVRADLASFEDAGVLRGQAIADHHESARTTVAGFLRACRERRADVRPLLYAYLNPCGIISSAAFEQLTAEILETLEDQGPFDVVLLAQHGAAVAESHPDADAELATRVRALVGRDVTIAVALDLHANVTERLIRAVDLAVAYHEHPHRDALERGAHCATLALECAHTQAKLNHQLVRLPMVVPVLGGQTDEEPMRRIMRTAKRVAAQASLKSYSLFHGFGYADVPAMGSSALAVTSGDPSAAHDAAVRIAGALWERREDLRKSLHTPEEAVAEADRRARRNAPAMVMDVGDNVGAGASGDSTILMKAAAAQGVRGVVASVCDARAARTAASGGLGADVELTVGASAGSDGGPLQVRGRVTRISDGRFQDTANTHAGIRFFDSGLTVRVSTARRGEVLISSRPTQTTSPEQLRAVAIEPRDARVIIAKGVIAPRAGYKDLVSAFVLADTPGITAAQLAPDRFRDRPQPLWPFESDARFDIHDRTRVGSN